MPANDAKIHPSKVGLHACEENGSCVAHMSLDKKVLVDLLERGRVTVVAGDLDFAMTTEQASTLRYVTIDLQPRQ